jgi:hypothetical protein
LRANCAEERRLAPRANGGFGFDSGRPATGLCERARSCRLEGLLARFGADAALPDVLMALASCERRKDFSRPCGARFTGLVVRR